MLRAIFGQQPRDDPAVGRANRASLIGSANHQARIEDVGQELIERAAAVQSDIGADLLTLAVELMTLATDAIENVDSSLRISRCAADQFPHFTD